MLVQADDILSLVYREFDVPVDQLITDPELGDRFVTKLAERVGESVDKVRTLKRLLTLRKKGRLPRLRR